MNLSLMRVVIIITGFIANQLQIVLYRIVADFFSKNLFDTSESLDFFFCELPLWYF